MTIHDLIEDLNRDYKARVRHCLERGVPPPDVKTYLESVNIDAQIARVLYNV